MCVYMFVCVYMHIRVWMTVCVFVCTCSLGTPRMADLRKSLARVDTGILCSPDNYLCL